MKAFQGLLIKKDLILMLFVLRVLLQGFHWVWEYRIRLLGFRALCFRQTLVVNMSDAAFCLRVRLSGVSSRKG